jgi:hypothetical protein
MIFFTRGSLSLVQVFGVDAELRQQLFVGDALAGMLGQPCINGQWSASGSVFRAVAHPIPHQGIPFPILAPFSPTQGWETTNPILAQKPLISLPQFSSTARTPRRYRAHVDAACKLERLPPPTIAEIHRQRLPQA